MYPAFKAFVKLAGLRLPASARPFWMDVDSMRFDERERLRLSSVEMARKRLLADARRFERRDFGAGSRRLGRAASKSTTVAGVAKATSVSPAWGRLLFALTRRANSRSVLELGTGVGLSAAYLQAALDLNGGGRLVTIEGDPELCRTARETLASVSADPGRVMEGRFTAVLPSVLDAGAPFDLLYIDGHHESAAVEEYLNLIVPHLTSDALVVLDDIQPVTGGVRTAWKGLIRRVPSRWHVDLLRMGVVRLETTQ